MALQNEKSISSSAEHLEELMSWLKLWLDEHNVGGSIAYKLRFAMEEITTNAVYYGFPTGTSGTVTVRINRDPDSVSYKLEILDDGHAFNPLEETPVVDTELEMDDREVGGLGVFLVKNLSENCHYSRVDGWNHLSVVIDAQ